MLGSRAMSVMRMLVPSPHAHSEISWRLAERVYAGTRPRSVAKRREIVGDKMGNNIRGGLEPRGSLSSADGNIPRGKRGSRRGFRAALGLIVSTMLVAVGTVGVGVMPAHAAEEVVSDWVCDARDHRATDFLISLVLS